MEGTYETLRFQYPWKTSTFSDHLERRTSNAGRAGDDPVAGTTMPSRSVRTVSVCEWRRYAKGRTRLCGTCQNTTHTLEAGEPYLRETRSLSAGKPHDERLQKPRQDISNRSPSLPQQMNHKVSHKDST